MRSSTVRAALYWRAKRRSNSRSPALLPQSRSQRLHRMLGGACLDNHEQLMGPLLY